MKTKKLEIVMRFSLQINVEDVMFVFRCKNLVSVVSQKTTYILIKIESFSTEQAN